jgi:hyperosmotically inducible periplasmic protein
MKSILILVIALGVGSAQAFAGQLERKDLQVANDVIRTVNNYSRFSIFDDVSVQVNNGMVTLTGKVTMPFKATDIAKRVAEVESVKGVDNRIEALPASFFDDQLRYRIARTIYGSPDFVSYAALANPPIHIVVDRGRVTLTGVVNSEVDKRLARTLASFSGAFSVKSELRTNAEARAELTGD